MKRRRNLFLHLSQLKVLVKKFALIVLFLAAVCLMILHNNANKMTDQVAGAATGVVAMVVDVLVVPAKVMAKGYDFFVELISMRKSNRELREENRELRSLKNKYDALLVENKLLTDLLNYVPLPDADFISAKVVAEENDAFASSLLAYIGDNTVVKGDVVLSDFGVVGRVDRVVGKFAKIILITDINSNIPVTVEKTRVRGILSGDNTSLPKLVFVPLGAEVSVGDKIVTSGVSGVFPAGLPIGHVVKLSKYEIKVKPLGGLEKLEYVKIVKYGLNDTLVSDEGKSDE